MHAPPQLPALFDAYSPDGGPVHGRTHLMMGHRAPVEELAVAFAQFHLEVGTHAARYAATILGPGRLDALDDVLQDAWVRAWGAWGRADPEHRRAWFLRIVRNCAIDQHRRHRVTEPLSEVEGRTTVDGIEDATIARVDADRTFALLGRMPTVLREALWLREVMDLTYADIAALQGVPIGTVMSRLHAARRRAARILSSAGRAGR